MTQIFFLDSKSIQNGDVAITDFVDTFTFGTNGSQHVPKADADIAALATTAGGNSFCLDFADSADLGNDISSNANDFTANSMSSVNQSTNTPSLTYPLLNPLSAAFSTPLSNGNTIASGSSGNGDDINPGIIIPKTGKWVWQITNTTDADLIYGVRNFSDMKAANYSYTNLYGFYSHTGDLVQGAAPSGAYLDPASGGDVYQIYFNADTRKMWVSDNGVIPNSGDPDGGTNEAFTIPDSGFDLCPTALVGGTAPNSTFDFGMDGVSLHPNGQTFKPLTSANLPTPDYQGIDYFNATPYTGNGTAIGSGGKAVTNVGFQPNFTWIKNRDAADSHILTDVVRGVTKYISSDSTAAEVTNTESLSTFDTDGFTLGNLAAVNTNTENYISWNWLAGGTGSSNTDGSITSTVTVANAGHFSIGTYTGTGAAGTVGHGLSGAPELVIVKNTNDSRAWRVLETVVNGGTHYLTLNTTAASTAGSTFWNDSNPTASVINLGSNTDTNDSGDTMVAIAFRSVPGVCKVGSYEGNGSTDGTYVSLGFKPSLVLCKSVDSTSDWQIFDKSRNGFNVRNNELEANDTAIEDTSTNFLDLLSDGFKMRIASDPNVSETFLYLAMADIGGNGTLPPIYGR